MVVPATTFCPAKDEGLHLTPLLHLTEVSHHSFQHCNHPKGKLTSHSDFLDGFSTYEVDLKLPRYETSSDTNDLPGNGLIGILKEMGINLAFDCDQAEIPNMCENGNVFINMMRQKARIKVNEEGLEAAAVTVGGFELTSYTPQPTEIPMADFHANRPFIYLIRESSSGAILFVGQFTGE